MIAVLRVILAANKKKESDENNIKTRQRRDRDKTALMLATRQQGKLTHKRTRPDQDINETGIKYLKLATK